MSKNHLFLQQHVFATNQLPSKSWVNNLVKPVTCPSCKKGCFTFIDSDIDKNIATYAYKCNYCYEIDWLSFSPFLGEKTYPDAHIILLNRHNDLGMKKQISDLKCRKCSERLSPVKSQQEIAQNLNKGKFSSNIMHCVDCKSALVIVFWVRPIHYFNRIQNIARKIEESDEAKLIMHISSLEIYFEKIFKFSNYNGKLNSFQRIKKVKEAFKKHFNIQLIDNIISNDDWNFLVQCFQHRHYTVHNGCYDENFNPITTTSVQIERLDSLINSLVKSINDELEKTFLF